MHLIRHILPLFVLASACGLGGSSSAQSPTASKVEKNKDGKDIDPCRQSGSMGARLANYRLQGKPLDELIADVRDSGVEEAPTPKVEAMAAEVYALRLLPAEAFERYQKSCPFRD